MTHWSNIKEKSCGYWPMQFLLKIYQIFGRPVFKLLLYPIVFVFLMFSWQTYVYSKQYLKRVIKDQPITYMHVFKHIFSFADSLADKIIAWSGHIPLNSLNIKTEETYNAFINNLKNKKGSFLVTSHLGNVEVLRAIGNISDTKAAINAIIQINHTEHFNKLLKKLNPKVSTNLFSATDIGIDTIIILKDKLNNGELLITSGDRTAARNQDKTLPVNFLGEEAPFPLGAFTLASLMDTPVYFIFLLKGDDGLYNLYMYKSAVDFSGSRKDRKDKINKIAEEYAVYLEKLVRQYPYQWYNFFDFWQRPERLLNKIPPT